MASQGSLILWLQLSSEIVMSQSSVYQVLCVEDHFPPWDLPGKDFEIAYGMAWNITQRFLAGEFFAF